LWSGRNTASKEKDENLPTIIHLDFVKDPSGIDISLSDVDVDRLLKGKKIVLGAINLLSISVPIRLGRLQKRNAKKQILMVRSC